MTMIHFADLHQHPIQALSFFAMGMALVSLWIKKSVWVWGSLGLISFLLALSSGLAKPMALIPLTFFALLLWSLRFSLGRGARFLLGATAFLVGSSMFFEILPGAQISSPRFFYMNYEKALMGLLLLGWKVQTLSFHKSHQRSWAIVFGSALLGTFVLVLLFWGLGLFPQNPHIHPSFLLSAPLFLVFGVLPEEALLRGFLQKELAGWIGEGVKGQICGTLITSCMYPLFHLAWAAQVSLLLPTFLAGLCYAILYQATKKIETSLLCHFLVGCLSSLFFPEAPLTEAFPGLSLWP